MFGVGAASNPFFVEPWALVKLLASWNVRLTWVPYLPATFLQRLALVDPLNASSTANRLGVTRDAARHAAAGLSLWALQLAGLPSTHAQCLFHVQREALAPAELAAFSALLTLQPRPATSAILVSWANPAPGLTAAHRVFSARRGRTQHMDAAYASFSKAYNLLAASSSEALHWQVAHPQNPTRMPSRCAARLARGLAEATQSLGLCLRLPPS